MRNRTFARSLVAAALVSLGTAALPATAQAGLLSDILQPVVDLLGGGSDNSGPGNGGSDNSGPGNAQDRPPDPPPPTAPPPPTNPAPKAAPAPGVVPAPAPASPAPATPAPVAAPPVHPRSPVSVRYLVGRHLLSPPPGRVLGGRRPTLRWRGGPARVDLYNVQIFSATGQKVVSAFPRSRSFPVPAKRLAAGRRYVWRVWPYTRGNGYTKRPMAVSWFAVASRTVLAQRAR